MKCNVTPRDTSLHAYQNGPNLKWWQLQVLGRMRRQSITHTLLEGMKNGTALWKPFSRCLKTQTCNYSMIREMHSWALIPEKQRLLFTPKLCMTGYCSFIRRGKKKNPGSNEDVPQWPSGARRGSRVNSKREPTRDQCYPRDFPKNYDEWKSRSPKVTWCMIPRT